jgi:hypothetical protein
LYDGDLPVILGHVMGLPIEESVLQLGSAGAAAGGAVTATAIYGRTMLTRMLNRVRRR